LKFFVSATVVIGVIDVIGVIGIIGCGGSGRCGYAVGIVNLGFGFI